MTTENPGKHGILTALALAVFAGAALILVAAQRVPTNTTRVSLAVTGAHQATPGTPAPVISGYATDGRHVDLAGLQGQVVVVDFFATWCTNCKADLPLLEHAQMQSSHKLQVIGVDYHDNGNVQSFLNGLGVTFPALLDPDSKAASAYGVNDVPVAIFIDKQGNVSSIFAGQLTMDTLNQQLRPLLS